MSVGERNYTVYMHVNKINGKKYIGITSQKPKYRWGKNGGHYKNNLYFWNAIQKYGWDNGFEHIYVGKCLTKEEAEYFEILLIAKLNTTNPDKGYNVEYGGNSIGKIPDEIKIKMSRSKKGKYTRGKNSQAKKVFCDNKIYACVEDCADNYEIKRRTMSDWIGRRSPMPQKFIDLELRYLDDDNKFYEVKSNRKGGNNSNAKKVICDEMVFDCAKDCAKHYVIKYDTMRSWLNGKYKTPQKYIDLGLRYYNPEVDGDIEQYEQYIVN